MALYCTRRKTMQFFTVAPFQHHSSLVNMISRHFLSCIDNMEQSAMKRILSISRYSTTCMNNASFCWNLKACVQKDSNLSVYKLLKKNMVSLNPARNKTFAAGSFVTELTKDIDLDALREEVKKERLRDGKPILLNDRIKEIVAEKCDAAVANLSPEDQRKLKVIKLEHNFLYSEGNHIPSPEEMTNQNWLEAMSAPSKAQRLKYFLYLSKRKYAKEAVIRKKQEKKEQQIVVPERQMDGYEHGRLFMRIYDTTITKWHHHRLAAAMQFGLPLVIDMDYIQHMPPREIKNTASQLSDLYCLNRGDKQPFHLHFTNCAEDNATYRLMQIGFQDQDYFATVTEKSYLDLFNKDELIYLSPEGRQVMKEFDPTAVYIIGAFNDKSSHKPVSYAKAKEQRLKCLRLPLDEYLDWNIGHKGLTLDQMIKIMISLKNGESWIEAFKAIPQRKVRPKSA